MRPASLQFAASFSLIGLMVLCVLWEGWLAPIRPGGSWLTLKALPLLLPLFGILRGKRYTYQWTSMLSLLYFTEGVLRVGDPGLMGVFAALELVLAMVLFFATMFYARLTAPSRQKPAE